MSTPDVAIVDYGLGNLFSVQQACRVAGLRACIAESPIDIACARAVILPGIGAFGDAMAAMRSKDQISALRDVARSGRPVLGICLGMQLLMETSEEFGHHDGLGIVRGKVTRLNGEQHGRPLKIPTVCWNAVDISSQANPDGAFLKGVPSHSHFYFVHSFKVEPASPTAVVGTTRFGNQHYCSVLRQDNVVGMQFHPERSGSTGIRVYENLARHLNTQRHND
jgi:imidazole glycerol-phosphate synthase subunit HisH